MGIHIVHQRRAARVPTLADSHTIRLPFAEQARSAQTEAEKRGLDGFRAHYCQHDIRNSYSQAKRSGRW